VTEYDQRDLVCLYLAAVEAPGGQSPVSAGLTATGIGDALEVEETAVGRVELLETLTALREDGLVVAEERPVDGLDTPRPVYGLTDAGHDHAASVRQRVSEQSVVVTNGTREEVSLKHAGRYFDGDAPLVTALGRLTEDGEVPLDRYTGEGFVGRETELETLREAVEASFTQESGAVIVTGTSGMGKTAVVEETVRRVREAYPELEVVRGSSPEGATDPYAAFKQAFGSLSASTGTALRDQLTEADSDVSPENPEELQARRQALFDDVADGIREAATGPLVVFLDNLQWADAATLALFEHLTTTLDEWLTPVAFVGTYRFPAVADTEHPLEAVLNQIQTRSRYTEVRLDPLSQGETRALLADVLGRHSLPEAFVEMVHEQTGGNPLFVHETATYLLETGAVDPQREAYPTADDEVQLPAEVTDQIASRLQHLDEQSRELLRLGAVLGERMPGPVLASASNLPTGRYREYVDLLVASHIWELVGDNGDVIEGERRVTADGGGDLQFVSGGLREAVVDRLPVELEREYHRRIAEAFEAVYEDADEDAGRLATHYEQAREYEAAFESYRRAGNHAAERYATEDAIEHYERALSLADEHGVAEETAVETVTTDLGTVCEIVGEFDRARECFERSLEIAQSSGRRHAEATARRNLGGIDSKRGNYDKAREHHAASLDIFRELGDRQAEATSRRNLGTIAWRQGEFDQAQAYYEESLDSYRELGDREGEANTLNNLGILAINRGEYEAAEEYSERSLDIFRELGDRRGEAKALNNLGILAKRQGEYEQAREYSERSIEINKEFGERQAAARSLNNLGILAHTRSEYDRAREYYEESLDIFRELGDRQAEATGLNNLGVIASYCGEYDRAREYYEESLDIRQEIGDRRGEATTLTNLGFLARTRGEYDLAHEYFTEARAIAKELGEQLEELSSRRELGALARQRGDYERAADHLDESLAACDQSENHREHARLQLERTRLALERDDIETARETGQAAYESFVTLEVPHFEARARLLQGRIAAASGSPDEARDHWQTALDIFQEVGAPQDTLATLRHLVETCQQEGDDEQAREWLERANSVFESAPDLVKENHRDWLAE